MPDARRHARAPPPPLLATSCFPGLPRCPGRSHAAAPHRSHSPSPSSSPPALSPSHPRTTAAADGHHRSHRLSLASPSSPGAPPRRQLPPRRATQAGVPRGAAIAVIFVVGRPRSSAPVRRLRLVPEPVDHPVASAVSFCACSPFSSSSPCAVAVLPLEAELRPPP